VRLRRTWPVRPGSRWKPTANQLATEDGVGGTPTFLIGRTGGVLHPFQPTSLTPAPFAAELDALLAGGG
jgi:hypothetical protein